ncbi:CAP domain-containing protein [Streptomyces sp. NPDC097981]|uniref:CAP domain-containing protein n=1 Tax=Streptomyces sp. NPDC097981 TaxID=3155428 RepID=UPI00331F879E
MDATGTARPSARPLAAYDAAGPNWNTNDPGYRYWGHYWNMVQKNYTKMGCGAAAGVTVCRYA